MEVFSPKYKKRSFWGKKNRHGETCEIRFGSLALIIDIFSFRKSSLHLTYLPTFSLLSAVFCIVSRAFDTVYEIYREISTLEMVRFENVPIISLAQRLAIEKQLLLEEKYLVFSVKKIKEERQALQVSYILASHDTCVLSYSDYS